jgi:hypothetical protein
VDTTIATRANKPENDDPAILGKRSACARLQLCAQRFPSSYRIAYFNPSAAAVDLLPAIVVAIVMVIAMSRGHVEVTMVPMPVSLANADADVADLNSDVFRDDHWLVASAQSAGKCRHR